MKKDAVRSRYEAIKHVWIYGHRTPEGNKLVADFKELAEVTGTPYPTIQKMGRRLVDDRNAVYKERLMNDKHAIGAFVVDNEHYRQHKEMVDKVKMRIDDIEQELEGMDVIDPKYDKLVQLHLKLKKEWEKDVGVDAMRSAISAVVKEQQLKIAEKALDDTNPEDAAGKSDNAKQISNSSKVFDVG